MPKRTFINRATRYIRHAGYGKKGVGVTSIRGKNGHSGRTFAGRAKGKARKR